MARAKAYPHAKFHLDPSNRLATVHKRHKQDRTDIQRSDSIGQTVLQMVAQKPVPEICDTLTGFRNQLSGTRQETSKYVIRF